MSTTARNVRSLLLRADHLARHFPPGTHALRDASLSIDYGETVAVVGPSGSGKSTLLALLGLLDTPTQGRLEIQGIDATAAGARARTRLRRDHIGFIFQSFHLIPHLTVTENVLFGLEAKGIGGVEAHIRARQHLNRVGLLDRQNAFPSTLSGGEQQRTAIARALAAEPNLVLCDEPTGNLDSAASQTVLHQLLAAATGRSAVVIVTHDPEIARGCDRVIRVRDGIATAHQGESLQ